MTTDAGNAIEQVVLLGADGKPSGSASKAEIHTTQTPLHLAFSVYLFDDDDQVLMTRRALTKKTWPGVWTNSCCGHPSPGEQIAAAARRRVKQELGYDLDLLRPLLPDFSYRAVDDSGIVENEFCPVFGARASGTAPAPAVDPAEVSSWAWTDWRAIISIAAASPFLLSPWAVLQLRQMASAGDLQSAHPPLGAGDHPSSELRR